MSGVFEKVRMFAASSRALRLLGIELSPVGHVERLVSMAGGIVAIYVMILLERDILGQTGAAMLIGSMGATAVLLFAVPHGALSQPWAVIVGHAVSAAVGVTCARFIPIRCWLLPWRSASPSRPCTICAPSIRPAARRP